MATQPPPSTDAGQFQGKPQDAAAAGARTFPPSTLDLRTMGSKSRIFPVAGMTRASARVQATSFGAAVVAVRGSIDAENLTALPIAVNLSAGTPESLDFSIAGRSSIQFEVTTADAAADQDARCYLYPFRPRGGEASAEIVLIAQAGPYTF